MQTANNTSATFLMMGDNQGDMHCIWQLRNK